MKTSWSALLLLLCFWIPGIACQAERGDLDPDEMGLLHAQPARQVIAKPVPSQIEIEWHVGGAALDYVVMRRESSSSVWTELGTVAHNPPIARPGTQVPPHTFTDTGATNGVEYVYGIRARNVKSDSAIVESNRVQLP